MAMNDLRAFKSRLEAEVLSHPIIVANPYTAWFERGEFSAEQARAFLTQFSVSSNQFLVAQLQKVLNAETLEEMRASKEILANEIGGGFLGPARARLATLRRAQRHARAQHGILHLARAARSEPRAPHVAGARGFLRAAAGGRGLVRPARSRNARRRRRLLARARRPTPHDRRRTAACPSSLTSRQRAGRRSTARRRAPSRASRCASRATSIK